MIPIPESHGKLLKDCHSNFSLYFPRMVKWIENDTGEKMKDKDCINQLFNASNERLRNADLVLKKIHERQTKILLSLYKKKNPVFEFKADFSSAFISGLGSGHPSETGMILDRNSGLPYIPASSIKGVMRLAHALCLAEINPEAVKISENGGIVTISDKEPSLRRLFGDTDSSKDSVRGQLVFLDAFPSSVPELKIDIMNPHFTAYYDGTNPQPLETESPVPIKFLSVKERTSFTFRCYYSSLNDNQNEELKWQDNDAEYINGMFRKALVELGIGSKTAAGYGHCSAVNNNTESLSAKIVEIERNKKQEEEKEKFESLSPDEQAKYKFLAEKESSRNALISNDFLSNNKLTKNFFEWLKDQLVQLKKWNTSGETKDSKRCKRIQEKIDELN